MRTKFGFGLVLLAISGGVSAGDSALDILGVTTGLDPDGAKAAFYAYAESEDNIDIKVGSTRTYSDGYENHEINLDTVSRIAAPSGNGGYVLVAHFTDVPDVRTYRVTRREWFEEPAIRAELESALSAKYGTPEKTELREGGFGSHKQMLQWSAGKKCYLGLGRISFSRIDINLENSVDVVARQLEAYPKDSPEVVDYSTCGSRLIVELTLDDTNKFVKGIEADLVDYGVAYRSELLTRQAIKRGEDAAKARRLERSSVPKL